LTALLPLLKSTMRLSVTRSNGVMMPRWKGAPGIRCGRPSAPSLVSSGIREFGLLHDSILLFSSLSNTIPVAPRMRASHRRAQ
jgi:hypothetical protein